MPNHFKAPWGLFVMLVTLMSLVLLLVVPVAVLAAGGFRSAPLSLGLSVPILIVFVMIPFAVTGYTILPDELLIHRPGRVTSIPLAGLRAVERNPKAMARSLRTFGNGGLFVVCGHFRNHALGKYQAFVTDPKRSVVMKYDDHAIVVSPEPVDSFVQTLKRTRHL